MERLISGFGMLLFVAVAVACSRNRKAIDWRMVASSLVLQILLAVLLLKTSGGVQVFVAFAQLVNKLMEYSGAGINFVFGNLAKDGPWGFVFFAKVLPTIIFFSALMNVLYYLGIMQKVIGVIAALFRRLLNTSGAETLCNAANIFMGQTEAPLLIRPFVPALTESELFLVMVSGFATLAAGVLFVYASFFQDFLPSAAGHLLTASVLSAPGAILMAKILVPETGEPATRGEIQVQLEKTEANVIEAAASGASTGLHLALNVGAMLIAFLSLVALINGILGAINPAFSLQAAFGVLFSPLAWLVGTPSQDCKTLGNFLGQSLILNEFVAYNDMRNAVASGSLHSARTVVLGLYALCGFTNLSSIAIQIGGIGALAEARKTDLARLGFMALFAATLVNLQTASLAGLLMNEEALQTPPAASAPATSQSPAAAPSASPSPTTPSPTPTPPFIPSSKSTAGAPDSF